MALFIVVTGIALGLLGLWLYLRTPPTSRPVSAGINKREDPKRENQAQQWGVRVAAADKERTCPQVQSLLGKEFTMVDKPSLPLYNCPFPRECSCRFVPLMDRRKEERRSGTERRFAQRYGSDSPPRRSGKDRRKGGVDWDTHGGH